MMWAIKAYEHAEIYFNVSLLKINCYLLINYVVHIALYVNKVFDKMMDIHLTH